MDKSLVFCFVFTPGVVVMQCSVHSMSYLADQHNNRRRLAKQRNTQDSQLSRHAEDTYQSGWSSFMQLFLWYCVVDSLQFIDVACGATVNWCTYCHVTMS